jgi:glutamyl-tRNA synthetase
MRNSLTLSPDEVSELISSGSPYVVRLKIPEHREIVVHDIVRGEVKVQSNTMDDKILMKSDGFPTYHLANVVDDHLMHITHVIRGEEWLPSAPLHSLLYEVLGWSETMPQMAHLPLLLKPEGTGKLSKRDADKHGFPIFPLNWIDPNTNDFAEGFREQGYLPEAMVNFLAFLGWNPGTEEEMFDMPALVQAFDLARIGKSGAKFDIEKAKWYNQQYLRKLPVPELGAILARSAKANHVECDRSTSEEVASLMVERITFPQDLWNQSRFFFVSPSSYDEKFARKKWTQEGVDGLNVFAESLDDLNIEDGEVTKQKLYDIAEAQQVGFGKVMAALRLALTGFGGGPDIFSIIRIIGKDETKVRILRAIELLEV